MIRGNQKNQGVGCISCAHANMVLNIITGVFPALAETTQKGFFLHPVWLSTHLPIPCKTILDLLIYARKLAAACVAVCLLQGSSILIWSLRAAVACAARIKGKCWIYVRSHLCRLLRRYVQRCKSVWSPHACSRKAESRCSDGRHISPRSQPHFSACIIVRS